MVKSGGCGIQGGFRCFAGWVWRLDRKRFITSRKVSLWNSHWIGWADSWINKSAGRLPVTESGIRTKSFQCNCAYTALFSLSNRITTLPSIQYSKRAGAWQHLLYWTFTRDNRSQMKHVDLTHRRQKAERSGYHSRKARREPQKYSGQRLDECKVIWETMKKLWWKTQFDFQR